MKPYLIFCIGYALLLLHPLVAQESMPVFLNMGSMADASAEARSLNYWSINGPDELQTMTDSLSSGSTYLVVKRLSFMEGVNVVHNLQRKIDSYQELQEAYWQLKAIEERRHAVFETLIAEEQKRVELYQQANAELNTQINSLNAQFEAASEVSTKAIKGQTGQNLKMGIVGGVIGLASGVVVGLLGTRN